MFPQPEGEAAGSQGRSPLFMGGGEKVFSNVLMRRCCSLSYSMIGLALIVRLLLKFRRQNKK